MLDNKGFKFEFTVGKGVVEAADYIADFLGFGTNGSHTKICQIPAHPVSNSEKISSNLLKGESRDEEGQRAYCSKNFS